MYEIRHEEANACMICDYSNMGHDVSSDRKVTGMEPETSQSVTKATNKQMNGNVDVSMSMSMSA
jgi:hypothetical protein